MRRWIPLTVLALLLGLMVLLHWAAPSGKLLRHPITYLGALPVLIGAIIGALGLHQLLKARTTVKAFHQPDRLVSDGIFRYTRNPIYLGAVLILSGACILMGVHCLLIPAAIFMIIAGRWFVRVEEGMLARKFGKAWEEYRARTPRWISIGILASPGGEPT